ncbi:MAG: hypothetical protein ACREXS_08120 [Gammaproteobacteria bacterium]
MANVLDGLNDNLYDEQFVRVIFDWWSAFHDWRFPAGTIGHTDEKELLGNLDLLLFENKPPDFRSADIKPDFRLACTRNPGRVVSSGCANVTILRMFLKYQVRESDRRTFAAQTHVPFSPEVSDDEVEYFVSKGGRLVHLRPNCVIGKPLGVLWVTLAERLADSVTADQARDRLGLIHMRTEDGVLAVRRIPAAAIKSSRYARPIFADAASHRRFKARADTVANRSRSTWGTTADLERLANSKRSIDGLVERVVEPIQSATIGQRIFVQPLGRVTIERGGDPSDNDQAFATRLHRQHGGVADIRVRMKRVLSLP